MVEDFQKLKNKALPLTQDGPRCLRRRHSSEGVDAKFGSTLPKDFAGEVVFDLIFWSL